MDVTERNNSRACALTIRTRGGFNGMVVYLTFHRMHYGYIPQMVLLQSFLLELLNMPLPAILAVFTRSLTTIRGIGNHPSLPVMSTRTFFLDRSTGSRSSTRKIFSLNELSQIVYALEFFAAHEPEVLFFLRSSLTKMVHAPRTTRYLDSWSRHCVLRRAVRSWPGRVSKD